MPLFKPDDANQGPDKDQLMNRFESVIGDREDPGDLDDTMHAIDQEMYERLEQGILDEGMEMMDGTNGPMEALLRLEDDVYRAAIGMGAFAITLVHNAQQQGPEHHEAADQLASNVFQNILGLTSLVQAAVSADNVEDFDKFLEQSNLDERIQEINLDDPGDDVWQAFN